MLTELVIGLAAVLPAVQPGHQPDAQPDAPDPQAAARPPVSVPETASEPWVIVADRDRWLGIDPAGGPTKEWPRMGAVAISADGRFEAAVGREPHLTALIVADRSAPGAAPAVIAKDMESLAEPAWLPDGSGVVFTAGGESGRQVYVARRNADGWGEPVRLSDDSGQCSVPEISSTGRIAFAVVRSRRGKQKLSDLIVHSGESARTVVAQSEILGFAWSPAGDRLAVCIPGSVHLMPLDPGETRVIDLRGIDPRLQSHGASHLAWRPDGQAIAADFRFLGGRSAPAGQPMPEFFGDNTIFILPLVASVHGGKLVALRAPDRVQGIRWASPPADAVPAKPRPDETER